MDSDDLTPEQQLWGAASMVLRVHGEGARAHVAERLGSLALAGDRDGLVVWQEIAIRLEELIENGGSIQ